jgi:hypothetical protein
MQESAVASYFLARLPHRERVLASAVPRALRRRPCGKHFLALVRSPSASHECYRRVQRREARFDAPSRGDRDEALKVLLQNLLDSVLIAFKWGIRRCWSVRVD